MYDTDDLIQLSALQHIAFCPRQCALIHIEQAWTENRLTAEGRLMHERVHEEDWESRGDVRIERGVGLRSLRLGLTGKADVVEYHRLPDGAWRPFPVEYKRGKPKPDDCDRIQLCAQAICLEEMLATAIPCGAIFYGRTRRRLDVAFDDSLRKATEQAAEQARTLISSGATPKPVYSGACGNCSMSSLCQPKALHKKRSIKSYLSRMIKDEA